MRLLKISSTLVMRRLALIALVFAGLILLSFANAHATLTVEPSTWNVIGLDSNNPLTGPNRFPVGAKVCSTTDVSNVVVDFYWDPDSANPYVDLRSGSQSSITISSIAAGECADAYFEVEVSRDAAAFDTTRRYYIKANGVSSPTPRELYIEHLVSQSRNYITDIKVDGTSIPAGGYMNLVVGQTYTIDLYGGTATQGYNQYEEFIDFPNTIFQILSVSTEYSANNSPYVSDPDEKLYADACLWENDPDSPYYLSCVGGDYKSGGNNVITTYVVKIIAGGGTSQSLNTLLYDFSGSSFHYNADYSTELRIANIIDPTLVDISKNFSPDPTNAGGVTALTFTLTNPNAGVINNVSFSDDLPTSPGAMVVADPPSATTNGCGTPTFSPIANATSISFSNGSIGANSSCTVKVNVTPPTTGIYNNVSNDIYVGSVDTGNYASDTLTVNTTPPPPTPPSSCPGQEVELARWTMDPSQGTSTPPAYFSKAANVSTATASYTTVSGTNTVSTTVGNPINSWGGTAPTTVSGSNYGWYETPTSMNNYFQFVLDTSKYGGLQVTFDVGLPINGDWANPSSDVYVNTSADGGSFTVYSTGGLYPQAIKGGWTTLTASAASTGTSTTTFRFATTSSGKTKTTATMYLDNVIFKGCVRPDPPTITKAFSPNPVAVNATSTLTFTVTNPNVGGAINGVSFTDTLPTGVEVATGSSSQCGGTLSTTAPDSISFTGGTISAGGSCNISATVTATTAGPHDNVSGFVNSTEGGGNYTSTGIATASLRAILPPSISKQFDPNPILANGVSTLTFLITNPNQDDALSGVAFADIFPTSPDDMVVAPTPNASTTDCGTPTFSPLAGSGSIAFSNGTIAAGGTCIVTVDITAPTVGTYDNTSGYVSHLISSSLYNGNTASASLSVEPPSPQIALLKQVSTSATGPWTSYISVTNGTSIYYQFTVENTGDVPLSSISVSDPQVSAAGCTWTDPLPVADPYDDDHIDTCVVGPVTAVEGYNSNTATASGSYGGGTYTDDSTAMYATTHVAIDKRAAQTFFTDEGDVLNYSYIVTNDGYATLKGPVTVSDDKSTDESCPGVSTVGDGDSYLDPGESVTCTATYTVTAGDITALFVTNIANATVDSVTSANDTVTVPKVNLTVKKEVVTDSDPVNGTSNPKAIPGALMLYTITVTNVGMTNADSITITDLIPADTEFVAGDIDGGGSGPVRFTDGSISSGLSYSFIDFTSTLDSVSFSDNGGSTYNYEPNPDGDGIDPDVDALKVTLSGSFNPSDGTNDPYFEIEFKVRVK